MGRRRKARAVAEWGQRENNPDEEKGYVEEGFERKDEDREKDGQEPDGYELA